MASQDNAGPLAIPSQVTRIVRKLVKQGEEVSKYTLSDASKAGTRDFVNQHPVNHRYAVTDSESNQDDMFKANNISKDLTTKNGDFDHEESERAHGNNRQARKIAEAFARKVNETVAPEHSDAKELALGTSGAEKKLVAKAKPKRDTQPLPTFNIAIPPQVAANRPYVAEGSDPSSPSPATSDSPSMDSDNKAPNTDNDKDKESANKSDSASAAKDALENIAMNAAELFEGLADDAELPSWVMEKLQLAQQFLESIKDEIGSDAQTDSKGEGENNGEPDQGKSKPNGNYGNQAKAAMNEEKKDPEYKAHVKGHKDILKRANVQFPPLNPKPSSETKTAAKIVRSLAKEDIEYTSSKFVSSMIAKLRGE